MLSIFTFILILFVLITVHEFGHFIAAKLCKMRVDEFAFGFPPVLFSKKYKDTKYSFNILPIGGYVKIAGENIDNNNDNLDNKNDKGLFVSRPRWQQLIVVFAGVFMNIVLAFFVFLFLAKSEHLAIKTQENKNIITGSAAYIVGVIPDSPAYKNGIREKDIINKAESVDKQGLILSETNSSEILEFLKENNNSVILNITNSKGENRDVSIAAVYGIDPDQSKKVYGIGVAEMGYIKLSFIESIKQAYSQTLYILVETFVGTIDVFDKLINGANISSAVSGPIGIYKMVEDKSNIGVDVLLTFVAIISINLAVFNILPVPALDGGRAVFIILEMILRRNLNHKFKTVFNGIGFLLLLMLMIFIIYKDILKFI